MSTRTRGQESAHSNNITGDKLVSKPTEGYQDGYDRIWGSKTHWLEEVFEGIYKQPTDRVLIKDNEKVKND